MGTKPPLTFLVASVPYNITVDMAWARIALLCPWGTKLLCPRVCRRIAHAVHGSLALRFPFRNQVFGCCPLDRLSLQPILALSSIRRGCLDHRSLARFGYGISAVCASRQRMHICTLSTLPSHSLSLTFSFSFSLCFLVCLWSTFLLSLSPHYYSPQISHRYETRGRERACL